MAAHYIGLMSGTSLDGADGVLVRFAGPNERLEVLATAGESFSAKFKAELLALNTSGVDELHRAALAASELAQIYARLVHRLHADAAQVLGVPAAVAAIGAHGQTVRHRPDGHAGQPYSGYTLQLNNPALLAELTGCTVVADFRSRDVAAGGQGAPLVPAFHQQLFGRLGADVWVLNIGGMANLSIVPATERVHENVLGFDCGPGNCLMDAWCRQHTGQHFDNNGNWAATGRSIPALLDKLLAEPYLNAPPPKSTGRDLFSTDWLARHLAPFAQAHPADIQYTLTELTAQACCRSLAAYQRASQDQQKTLIVCGGGAFNQHLMSRLQAGLPGVAVLPSSDYGLGPLQVEAAAFAWLARQTMQRRPGNIPSVTGATGARVLGAIYPA